MRIFLRLWYSKEKKAWEETFMLKESRSRWIRAEYESQSLTGIHFVLGVELVNISLEAFFGSMCWDIMQYKFFWYFEMIWTCLEKAIILYILQRNTDFKQSDNVTNLKGEISPKYSQSITLLARCSPVSLSSLQQQLFSMGWDLFQYLQEYNIMEFW